MRKLQQQSARVFAIGAIIVLYGMSQLPALSQSERASLAADFGFSRTELALPTGFPEQTTRTVHPELEQIVSWLSAVGASTALNDLDGDGLPNDICQVDPRIEQVIIEPVPGSPARYAQFVLDPSGLDYDVATMTPFGCMPADMNEDGQMDLLVYYWGRAPIAYLHNGQAGGQSMTAASYTAQDILPTGGLWTSSAGTFADLDGDGHTDLIITNYFLDDHVVLDRASDNPTPIHRSMSNATNGGGTHIFLWESATAGPNPMVSYRHVTDALAEEVSRGWTLAIAAADLNGDLLPEIYFANDFGPDRLLHNQSTPGDLRFRRLEGEKFLTTPKSQVLGFDSFKGMGVDFGDINNDGFFDIYVSNIADDFALHESHFMWLNTGDATDMASDMDAGIAPYVDAGEELGVSRSSWGWESRLADFNNDGVLEAIQATGFLKGDVNRWPELQELVLMNDELVTAPHNWHRFQTGDDLSGHDHNPFFVRAADGRFYDVAAELGIADPFVSRGIATADVDGDGDLDFAIANQWEPSFFFQNDCPECGAFLGLHLLLPVAAGGDLLMRTGHPAADTVGYPAVGALATVTLPDGSRLINFVDGGNGQAGARSSDLHFGLGDLPPDSALDVDIHWRGRTGEIHERTVQLTPGWHTVVLGN